MNTTNTTTLPLEHCAEYDAAAEYLAQRGLAGDIGDPLPPNMASSGALKWIQADPEAFQERVRQCAYARSMGTAAITKRIEWSYPSSGNATRFGLANYGCYTVETVAGNEPPSAVAGFLTLAEARAHAETLPFPWDRYTK